MSAEQRGKIINILVSAALTVVLLVAGVFGYDAWVVQPRLAALDMSTLGAGGSRGLPSGGLGVIRLADIAVRGLTVDNGAVIAAPTAIATATPAVVIDSAGVSNLLSIRAAGTPVFQVYASGVVNGKVLRYATTGQQIVCGSTTITGTGTLAHGLATPSYVQLSLAQDVTGNCARLSYTNASATVTAKCWNTALTPAAATTPIPVNWCVIGTP